MMNCYDNFFHMFEGSLKRREEEDVGPIKYS